MSSAGNREALHQPKPNGGPTHLPITLGAPAAVVKTGGDLVSCATRIREATDRLGNTFAECVGIIGGELRRAQELLAKGRTGTFGRWVAEQFGWSRRQAYFFISASETMEILCTNVHNIPLPSSESHCRELAKVPIGDRAGVWARVVAAAEEAKRPITARLVRQAVSPILPAKLPPEPKPLDLDKALCEILNALRDLLERTSEQGRARIANVTGQLFEIEFQLPTPTTDDARKAELIEFGKFSLEPYIKQVVFALKADIKRCPQKHRLAVGREIRRLLEQEFQLTDPAAFPWPEKAREIIDGEVVE